MYVDTEGNNQYRGSRLPLVRYVGLGNETKDA